MAKLITYLPSQDPSYTTDYWIQESIKRIFNSGLFWAVGAAEKKKTTPNCHKYPTFWGGFLMFSRSKNNFEIFSKIS